MSERLSIRPSTVRKSPFQFMFRSNLASSNEAVMIWENMIGEYHNLSYEQGLEDGRKNMEAELIKRGKALYQLAFQKITQITQDLVEGAESNNISIVDIHLKLDNWDCANTIIFVKLEDYLDEKIESLYDKAHAIAQEINDPTFHWDYSITYYSESLNTEKLISDGFQFVYEHTTSSRTSQ